MKISELYNKIISESSSDMPSISDFPTFDPPKKRLPDPNDKSVKDWSQSELDRYYDLASKYQAAAEDATGSYISKENFVLGLLEEKRAEVFVHNFSGDNKGGNAESRNAIVETDPDVKELRRQYQILKAQRQRMEKKAKGITSMVILYGGERKHRRESSQVPSEGLQETF